MPGANDVQSAIIKEWADKEKVDVKVDYVGFTIEDRFVVGYGLDYAGRFRNLRHIAVLKT